MCEKFKVLSHVEWSENKVKTLNDGDKIICATCCGAGEVKCDCGCKNCTHFDDCETCGCKGEVEFNLQEMTNGEIESLKRMFFQSAKLYVKDALSTTLKLCDWIGRDEADAINELKEFIKINFVNKPDRWSEHYLGYHKEIDRQLKKIKELRVIVKGKQVYECQ